MGVGYYNLLLFLLTVRGLNLSDDLRTVDTCLVVKVGFKTSVTTVSEVVNLSSYRIHFASLQTVVGQIVDKM